MQPSAKQITPSGVRPLFRHKSSDTRSLVKDGTEEFSHEDRNILAIKLNNFLRVIIGKAESYLQHLKKLPAKYIQRLHQPITIDK